jgi:hypothetical protein
VPEQLVGAVDEVHLHAAQTLPGRVLDARGGRTRTVA